MFDRLIHRWLRVPYTLNVRSYQSPKNPRATVILLHGIGSSVKMWQRMIESKIIDQDIRVLAVDLLGFGDSPRPDWKVYDVATQSKSLTATLLTQMITGPIIIVGHSLGALVATNYAHSSPKSVHSLILCSPPFYRPEGKSRFTERKLRSLYRKIIASEKINRLLITDLAQKYQLINPGYRVNKSNLSIFLDTLDAAIINQNSLQQITDITAPVDLIYGRLDPVVINKNLQELVADNDNVTLTCTFSSHEIDKRYAKLVAEKINQHADLASNRSQN